MQNNKRTPSKLDFPCFLMNFPFTVNNDSPNNVWMKENKQDYNYERAFSQFMNLYHYVAEYALVYILPSEGNFQDLTFVANIGCYLPHIKNKDTILIANFRSKPRIGEEKIGLKFFNSMGYKVIQPPYKWEGEADLKYIKDNIYIAGYGLRSDLKAYKWMHRKFDMNVVPIKMMDEKLYHFDCVFFPLGENKAFVATKVLSDQDIKAIENVVEIIDIPEKYIYNGWTNNVLIGNKILHAPPKGDNVLAFESFVAMAGFEPVIMNLDEYAKSGADLSCMLLHLNHNNRLTNYSFSKSKICWWNERIYKLPKNLYKARLNIFNASRKNDVNPEYTITFSDLPIVVEYGVGSQKIWKHNGKTGLTDPYKFAYGFIDKTKTSDGEALDCYLGPNEEASHVYLVKQLKPETGAFDEIKCMLGFNSLEEATKAYMDHYKDKRFFGGIIPVPMNDFKNILKNKQDLKLVKSILLKYI